MIRLPALAIALPVYNGGGSLPKALDALLAQTYESFTITIFDNASTDETAAISAAYQAQDARVRYERRTLLIPAYDNFRLALVGVSTPYFMFAAADDYWKPTYIERNIEQLQSRADAIASCSQVQLIYTDGTVRQSDSTRPLEKSVIENLKDYLRDPSDNSRFYSVFRTEILQRAFEGAANVFAGDWLVMALTLQWGCHAEVREVLMLREATPHSRYLEHAATSGSGSVSRVVPASTMLRLIANALPGRLIVRLLPTLAGLGLRSMTNSPVSSARALVSLGIRIKSLFRSSHKMEITF